MSTKRLQKELRDIESAPLDFCSFSLAEDDNLFSWNALMIGPEESPYEGGSFVVHIEFPADYPFKPPVVKFLTKVYHPSVKQDSGEICADVITGEWSPVQNAKYVMHAIRDMLVNYKETSTTPLEAEVGAQLLADEDAFVSTARDWTAKYASG